MMTERSLTDEDVEAILDAFEERFYTNLGKGLWALVWKSTIVILLGIAGYGALHK